MSIYYSSTTIYTCTAILCSGQLNNISDYLSCKQGSIPILPNTVKYFFPRGSIITQVYLFEMFVVLNTIYFV